jgi:hypothetical protein
MMTAELRYRGTLLTGVFLTFAFATMVMAVSIPAHAAGNAFQDAKTNLSTTQTEAEVETRSIEQIIGGVIKAVLGISGVVFVILIVYAGFMWMTDLGNADRVKKAKSILSQATIGLIICLAAYAITVFVVTKLTLAAGI